MNKKITAFLEPQSGAWFWVFEKDWSVYRSSQGYGTKDQALESAFKKWQSLILAEK